MRDHALQSTKEKQADSLKVAWVKRLAARITPDWVHSLSRRVVTAIVAIPVVMIAVWFGGWADFATVSVLTLLGVYELRSMFVKLGYKPLTNLSFLSSLALFLGIMLFPSQRQTVMEFMISLVVLGSLSWLLITRHKLGTALMDWALTQVMTMYLAWPLSYLLSLRGMQTGAATPNFWWTLIALFGVWAFDSAAFFAGKFFGKHPLAPVISPGKTWEGVIGGTFLSITAVFIFSIPIRHLLQWYHVLILGLLISFAATIGDLAESLIKRQANVKDSGNFFWGHGGVLDRIDSLLFVAVVVFFYVTLVLHGI